MIRELTRSPYAAHGNARADFNRFPLSNWQLPTRIYIELCNNNSWYCIFWGNNVINVSIEYCKSTESPLLTG